MRLLLKGIAALGIALVTAHLAGCERASGSKKTRLPVSFVMDSARAEELQVLYSRGAPDAAWKGPIGVTVWAYCDSPTMPSLIEFGSDGRILAEWKTRDTSYCSLATGVPAER